MKIYFSGSIRGGRKDASLYADMINCLKEYGDVLTEHIGDASLSSKGEKAASDRLIHDKDIKLLLQSDIVIAEVTNPSLGVGYEVGRAVHYGKRIVCFYRDNKASRLSAMIAGSESVECINYESIETFKAEIKKIFL